MKLNLDSDLKLTGEIKIQIIRNGETIVDDLIKNLVVTSGKKLLAKLLAKQPVDGISHLAIGSSSIRTEITDRMLGTEVFRAPITGVDINDNIVTFYSQILPGNANGFISEAGLFNAPNSGDMFSRAIFKPYFKKPEDNMIFVWSITIG